MIDAVRRQSGQRVREVLADSGYCSEANLRQVAKKKIDLYVATEKNKHNQPAQPHPLGRIPKSATLVERMKRKLQNQGRASHLRRAQDDRRAGLRTDQAGARLPAVSAARRGKGARRMVAGMHHAQSAEAAPPDYRLKAGISGPQARMPDGNRRNPVLLAVNAPRHDHPPTAESPNHDSAYNRLLRQAPRRESLPVPQSPVRCLQCRRRPRPTLLHRNRHRTGAGFHCNHHQHPQNLALLYPLFQFLLVG